MRLVLTLGASVLPFTPLSDDGPYPYLVSVGAISIAARAGAASGFGATETPNASVTLLNRNKRTALLIGNPLRAKAELFDGDVLAFTGTVAAIAYGLNIELTLEA